MSTSFSCSSDSFRHTASPVSRRGQPRHSSRARHLITTCLLGASPRQTSGIEFSRPHAMSSTFVTGNAYCDGAPNTQDTNQGERERRSHERPAGGNEQRRERELTTHPPPRQSLALMKAAWMTTLEKITRCQDQSDTIQLSLLPSLQPGEASRFREFGVLAIDRRGWRSRCD